MKYVYTRKIALEEINYDFDALANELRPLYDLDGSILPNATRLDPFFYREHPAPIAFSCASLNEKPIISSDMLHLLAVWYLRGTKLDSLKCKNPRPTWRYEFVDSLPNSYILKGYTTPQKAYEYGQHLIGLVKNANKISYPVIEEAYKTIARYYTKHGYRVNSRNAKTMPEVMAELEAEETIAALNALDTEATDDIPDELLVKYAKAFDVDVPAWYLKFLPVKTKNGFAMLPRVTQANLIVYQNSGHPQYAGNDDFDTAPYSLLRDSVPEQVCKETTHKQLLSQVSFYINLPREEQINFLAPEYDICPNCGIYNLRDGCDCGCHAPIEDDNEYYKIVATRQFNLSEVLYNA